jgi:arylsulfatase
MDLYPTIVRLAGGRLTGEVERDGMDITDVLMTPEAPRLTERTFYYYVYTHLQAVRKGPWKLVLPRPEYPEWTGFSGRFYGDGVEAAELYNLEIDMSEACNVAEAHPGKVEEMMRIVRDVRTRLGDYDRIGDEARFFDDAPRRPDVSKWQQKENDVNE